MLIRKCCSNLSWFVCFFFFENYSFVFFLIIFKAANFLNMKGLLDLTCKAVANLIKGRSPEFIRRTFHLRTDYTPAEVCSMQLCLFCVYMHTLYYRRNKFERKKNGHQKTKHNKTRRYTNEH